MWYASPQDAMNESQPARNATHLYRPNDFVALELARLASTRLDRERLERFRADVHRDRSRHGDNRYLRLWDSIIDNGPEAVRCVLLETSERGQILRSIVSFRAFVTKDERDEIVRRHARTFNEY
jgi:hypothetical protein